MEGFKEFEGKSLDAAIQDACGYYDAAREKLEIEILQDAKSGIFGLVGARKARIRARRAPLREALASALGRNGRRAGDREAAAETGEKPGTDARAPRAVAPPEEPPLPAAGKDAASAAPFSVPSGTPEPPAPPAPPDPPAALMDPEALAALAGEVVERLIRPIAGEGAVVRAEARDGRVRAVIEGADDSDLLIGREGQTLAALQYLASRIVSRAANAAVRVQLDASRYRQRQDDKLREIALALADRVRRTGRPVSTRPLSSYHRRIVHMILQDAPDVQTRSAGDGPLKRVTVFRRRPGQESGRERGGGEA